MERDGMNGKRRNERKKTERMEKGRICIMKAISSIRDRVCQDKQSGSWKQGPLRVQVRWLGAMRILHQCFRSLTNGQGRVVCKTDVCQSWSQGLRKFHTRVHLERRPGGGGDCTWFRISSGTAGSNMDTWNMG